MRLLVGFIVLLPINSYADRLSDLQQQTRELQNRIRNYKEVRTMSEIEFQVTIRNFQSELQRVIGASNEAQRVSIEKEVKRIADEKAAENTEKVESEGTDTAE